LIVKLEPSLYRKYIWHNKIENRCFICTIRKGAIWDATGSTTVLEAPILWGFTLNLYDKCVANQTIKG